jgi:hypothetical protein
MIIKSKFKKNQFTILEVKFAKKVDKRFINAKLIQTTIDIIYLTKNYNSKFCYLKPLPVKNLSKPQS